MFNKKRSDRTLSRRKKFSSKGRSLRYETMEGRLVLSASGFGGNECAPELDDAALDLLVPTQAFSPQSEIAFQFRAADVVSDAGVGATSPSDIRFILDPDLGTRTNGATPEGATLSLNDQGTTSVSDDTWDFSWTPSATQLGSARLFLIATDDGGTGNTVPLSDVYAFTINIDNRPSVDLNGSDENGNNAEAVSFTEADSSTPISLVDSDLFIFSVDGKVESVTVQIVDLQEDGLEALGITEGSSLVLDDSTPGQLVLTVAGGGTADKSVFEDALRTLTYNNTSQDPKATRTINVTINDGTATSAVSTATVNIQAVNDRPDLQITTNLPAAKVGEEYVLDLVATDPENSDLLVFRITSGPTGAVISPNGLADNSSDNTIQIARGDDGLYKAQIRWTPTSAQASVDPTLFTVVVTDTGGLADAKLYEIDIDTSAPIANADAFALGENAGETAAGDILTNDTNANGTLTVSSVSAGGSTFDVGVLFTHPTSGAEILVAANGQVQYNPKGQFESLGLGESEIDTLQYTSSNGNGDVSNQATVTITVNGANDAPLANDMAVAAVEGGPEVDGSFNGSDVDSGETATLTYTITLQPSEGSVINNNDGTFTFAPGNDFQDLAAGDTRDVIIDYIATDTQTVSSAAGTITVTITGVNDSPVASNVAADAVEDGASVNGNFAGTDTDNGETSTLTYAITSQPSEGSVVNNDDGTFTFDPGDDFQDLAKDLTRDVTFNYTATDAQAAASDEALATITVTGVNDAPLFNLSNTDGIASTLPTGDVQSANKIAVELDLSSSDANIKSLNAIDIPSFVSDSDGETIGISLAGGNNTGTAFRNENRPTLNGSNQLVWTPTSADIGSGYIIRVIAREQPALSGVFPTTFDLLVSVVAAKTPSVASVSDLDVALDASEVTILFTEAMGASAFVLGNYALKAIDGTLADTVVPVLSATATADNKGVVLQLSDALINSIAATQAGSTKLKLTLDSQIADVDGNALEAPLEFDVDLT